MRKTVAISLAGHDASICILNDYKIDLFIQEERLNRKKHSSCLDNELLKLLPNKIDDLILINFHDQSKVDKILKHTKAKNVILDDINHHLYHAASAFYLSNFKKAIALVIDGSGTQIKINNFIGSEASSIYDVPSFKPIYKEVMHDMQEFKFYDGKDIKTEYDLEIIDSLSAGIMYGTVSWFLGFGRLEGGKTMGLSAYGKESKLPNFLYKDSVNMNVFTQNRSFNLKHHPELKKNNFKNNANIAYNAQMALEKLFLNKMQYIKSKTKCKNIVFSGGCALNILGNSLIKKKYPEYNFFIDPIANDATLSLGAAKFHYYNKTKDTRFEKIDNVYLGKKYNIKESLNLK
jgi:carbamoyltransferase